MSKKSQKVRSPENVNVTSDGFYGRRVSSTTRKGTRTEGESSEETFSVRDRGSHKTVWETNEGRSLSGAYTDRMYRCQDQRTTDRESTLTLKGTVRDTGVRRISQTLLSSLLCLVP